MVTYLGWLVQLCFGKGGTLQTNITGVWGKCMDHTGFAPAQSRMWFLGLYSSGSRVLCTALFKMDPAFHALPRSKPLDSGSWVLCKGTDSVGPAFCALLRSEQLRQPGPWWVYCPRRATHLNHLPGLASQFPGCATRAPSQACHVSPRGSWSQVVTLLANVNHSGSQEDMVIS